MEIINTKWSFDSYMELKAKQVFTDAEYHHMLKPDMMLLLEFPNHKKFSQHQFWSSAEDRHGNAIERCYKMKWHRVGHAHVQLRLMVMIKNAQCFLCEAYVRDNDKTDKRKLAKLKVYAELIEKGQYTICDRWGNDSESTTQNNSKQ